MTNDNRDQTTPDNSNEEQPAKQAFEHRVYDDSPEHEAAHRSYEKRFMDGLEKK